MTIITDAQTVAHAVEPGEVGAHLTRKNEVVRAQRIVEVRTIHIHDLSTQAREGAHGLVVRLEDAILVAIASQLLDDADL